MNADSSQTTRLRANIIGPWGLAALAIGITSPAMGLYALWGPMQTAAGPITPLIFLAAMLLTLPTAISYALLNRERPSAAAAAAWLWQAVHPAAGFQAGLLMTTYFLMAAVAQPLMFALFFNELLIRLGVELPGILSLVVGVVIATLPVAWVCLRGAESSIKSTLYLMLIETLVVMALSLTIVWVKSAAGEINFSAFDLSQGQGISGFWAAMILGVLAFCGFDVVSAAAEEANAPREHLPKAILLTVIGIALFWALNAWAFTLSIPDEQVREYTSRGLTAVTPMAQRYWGWGNVIVILTAFTGLTAVYISSLIGTSRLAFALARHGLFPKSLTKLAGEKAVPVTAISSVLLAVILLDLGSIYLFGNGLEAFTWWANALVFFATLTFLSVNIANACYFWRYARGTFSFISNLLVPLVGVLMNGYLVYAAFFSALWEGSWRAGKSVVVTCLALLLLQLGLVAYVKLFKSSLLAKGMPIGADDEIATKAHATSSRALATRKQHSCNY